MTFFLYAWVLYILMHLHVCLVCHGYDHRKQIYHAMISSNFRMFSKSCLACHLYLFWCLPGNYLPDGITGNGRSILRIFWHISLSLFTFFFPVNIWLSLAVHSCKKKRKRGSQFLLLSTLSILTTSSSGQFCHSSSTCKKHIYIFFC